MNLSLFPMPHSIKRRLYISLGRYGDIIGILPAIQEHYFETGIKPLLMVAREFAGLLDGMSYLEPLIWKGPWQHCLEADATARSLHPECEIINCAVYGIGFKFNRQSANFQRDAWRLTRTRSVFGTLPLVFDQRDHDREKALAASVIGDPKDPFVLTCYSGSSAPFTGGPAINDALRARGFRVVDVSEVRAERIYDMLWLLEQASCLVVSDAALLHLAKAVPHLDIVSLVPDRADKWNRCTWLPQYIGRIYYSEAIVRPDWVVDAVILKEAQPKLVHAYCFTGPVDVETHRRMLVAHRSWQDEYERTGRWLAAPVAASDLSRDSSTELGDPKPAPFYRDVINHALDRCRPQDIVVISNADVGFTPGITGWIIDAMMRSGAIFAHRWDAFCPLTDPIRGEHIVSALKWYPGSDLWAFKASWWKQHGSQYPDMIIGREAGDMVLRHLVKNHGGVEIPRSVWHEKHDSYWEHYGMKESLPGNRKNRELAMEFLDRYGGDWNDWSGSEPS